MSQEPWAPSPWLFGEGRRAAAHHRAKSCKTRRPSPKSNDSSTMTTTTTLYLDLETYSETPITHGTHRYAEGAEILLLAWGIDGGPVAVVDEANGQPRPAELLEALADPAVIVRAHNSHFDRTVLRHTGTPIPVHRWRDTMVQALAHSLPAGLGDLCEVLKVPTDKAKDKAGKQLIQLFCKPRPAGSKIRRANKFTHPAEWERLTEYAALDIHAMRECAQRMPVWNYQGSELAAWHLDQRINDRGFCVDLELAHGALRAVDRERKRLAQRANKLTDGAVSAATQRDALLAHLRAVYGVELPDMQASTLERRVQDPDLPEPVRELLAVRLQASTSSTAKYKTMVNAASSDGRLRGTLQFNGASRTGRWAGRLFQPQNIARGTIKNPAELELGIEALKTDTADLIYGD